MATAFATCCPCISTQFNSPTFSNALKTQLVSRPYPIRTSNEHARRIITSQQPTSSSSSSSSSSDALPRFRRDSEEDMPRKSFFVDESDVTNKQPSTPNERVIEQLRATMDRLGIRPDDEKYIEPPRTIPSVQDLSRGNPVSALVGSVGAAIMSYAAWNMLEITVRFAALHPMDDRIYIVQRLTAVVRTGLVSIFALGSGISGVTSLGLLLVAIRICVATFTGEFEQAETDKKLNQD